MSRQSFNFKRFFRELDIPKDEQREVEGCLTGGVERYYDRLHTDPFWSVNELLGWPHVFGFGAVEVVRWPSLSAETRFKVARHALAQMRPVEDHGIPHGLPILLSFLAGIGALTVELFRGIMQMADMGGDLYDDWRIEEAAHLFDWLSAKADLPDSERLWWLWYLLAHCDKADIGRELLARCAAHPALAVTVKRDLCLALLGPRSAVQPPAHWRAVKAALHGDENALEAALAEMSPAEREAFLAQGEPGEADAPDVPPTLSFSFIRSLLSDGHVFVSPYLKRAAIVTLAETGEDLLTLCQTYLGQHDYYTDAINQGVADILRLHRASLPDIAIRELIDRALGIGKVNTRRAFYELGADFFGPEYWERARSDNANSIRVWATKQLAGETDEKPKKTRRRKREAVDEG